MCVISDWVEPSMNARTLCGPKTQGPSEFRHRPIKGELSKLPFAATRDARKPRDAPLIFYSLSALSRRNRHVRWVAGCSDFESNERVEGVAMRVEQGTMIGPEPFYDVPRSHINRLVSRWAEKNYIAVSSNVRGNTKQTDS